MQAKTKNKNPFESADYKQKIRPKLNFSEDLSDGSSDLSVMSNPNSGKNKKPSGKAKPAPAKK